MLKEHLKKKGISVYALSKSAGIPYSTLNDLSNGKVDLDNCRLGMVRALSSALGVTLEELLEICSNDMGSIRTSYGVEAQVLIRSKSYYTVFEYDGNPVELELCKINEDTSFYIGKIAQWRTEGYIRERRMEEPEWNAF